MTVGPTGRPGRDGRAAGQAAGTAQPAAARHNGGTTELTKLRAVTENRTPDEIGSGETTTTRTGILS
jgi:hypothetical protein